MVIHVNDQRLEDLRKIIKDNLDVKTSLMMSSDYPKLKKNLQHFLEIKTKDKSLKPVFEMILRYSLQAEENCPGSAYHLLRMFCRLDSVDCINKKSRVTREDVISSLTNLSYPRRITDLLVALLDSCSQDTKITVKKSSNSRTYIEVTEGHSFVLKKLFKFSPVILNDTKVSCIDGYIETVSEIHNLLTGLSETKDNCLLFCRGMSEDVLHTIKVNNDRKTLVLYPYVVPYDIDNVNTLVDIAVTSDTDVVSTTKGDLITSVNLETLGTVDRTVLNDDNVILTPSTNSKRRIENHVETLKKTIKERPEIEEVLSNRLKSLSSDNLYVCLPDDIRYHSDRYQIDEGIRIIMSLIKNSYGPFETAKFFFERLESSLNNLEF